MASEEDKDTLYCICRTPYNENEFMIECNVCKDWFHGSCVGILEHQAPDIETYHCPNCQVGHGPLLLKKRRWHRHDYSDNGVAKAVQTGTVIFIEELKTRSFPSADEIPLLKLPGYEVNKAYFDKNGFDLPIMVESKEGLGMIVPYPNFTIQDVEDHVGSMCEIDVIDVARQEDCKMLMREWTEYYNSQHREKIFNVISLEFSKTRLSELVMVPLAVREISWVSSGIWPESLPDDCPYTKPEVQKYCLMGVSDCFTDFHIDFGGSSVWYHVLRGEKIFYMIQPTSANLCIYETWLNAPNQSKMFFGDQVDKCYKLVVRQGQTVFIPTGWIHAVFTPIDSLVFGGNFLHSYSIPLQLEVYAIEKRVKTLEKYLFPSYETMNWYAAKYVLDTLQDYIEEGKKPPTYLFEGAKALVSHLRNWTQRKDFDIHLIEKANLELLSSENFVIFQQYAKTAKHEVPEHIQYGSLLKKLAKEVKSGEVLMKLGAKSQTNRKRKQKKIKIEGIDILHEHTRSKLEEMETERKNIYKFEDDEAVSPMTARFPKVGSYTDSSGTESPEKAAASRTSLTLKVSNGKIISERKLRKGEFQPFVGSDQESSNEDEGLIVDETPSDTWKSNRDKQPKLKLKLSLHHPATNVKPKSTVMEPTKITQPAISQNAILPHPASSPQPFTTVLPISSLLPTKTELTSPTKDLNQGSTNRPVKLEQTFVKSELTLSDIISQSALSNIPSTISKVEPLTTVGSEAAQELRSNIPTICGGLNGSIADILEASGYGTETAFTVDDDADRAPSPSMQEAIQGMLSMSRGSLSGMQLFSRAESRRQAIKNRYAVTEEDEIEQLSKCYQDDEYVYPTLEMDEDEQDQMLKGHGKPSKDQTWNPKARVNITVPLGERSHREGATKESVKNSLEASAAKIMLAPVRKLVLKPTLKDRSKQLIKKKPKLDIDSPIGTSSSFLSPSHTGSAFHPDLKSEGSSAYSANKKKRPKKGEATAKQRLGKKLKIHKLGMH